MSEQTLQVCIAARDFPPDYTGSGKRFQRYIAPLQKHNIAVSVFAGISKFGAVKLGLQTNALKTGENILPQTQAGAMIRRVYLGGSRRSCYDHYIYARALTQFCKRNNPDVLQLTSASLCMVPMILRLRRQGIPIVLAFTLVGSGYSKNPAKRLLQRIIRRIPHRIADHFVTGNIVSQEYLRDLGVHQPITIISHGVDTGRFKQAASQQEKSNIRKHLGLPQNAHLVLFVGALIPRKGIETLLFAWQKVSVNFPNAHLLLVGPSPSELAFDTIWTQKFEALCREAGGSLTLTGTVDNVTDYYQASDVFVFPSRREGMPNAVLEAYACGLPTILTPFAGYSPDLGIAETHHLLCEREPQELGHAISRLIQDSNLRAALSANARTLAVKNLSLDSAVEKYATLYQSLKQQYTGINR